jgi:hypothetical protein
MMSTLASIERHLLVIYGALFVIQVFVWWKEKGRRS